MVIQEYDCPQESVLIDTHEGYVTSDRKKTRKRKIAQFIIFLLIGLGRPLADIFFKVIPHPGPIPNRLAVLQWYRYRYGYTGTGTGTVTQVQVRLHRYRYVYTGTGTSEMAMARLQRYWPEGRGIGTGTGYTGTGLGGGYRYRHTADTGLGNRISASDMVHYSLHHSRHFPAVIPIYFVIN